MWNTGRRAKKHTDSSSSKLRSSLNDRLISPLTEELSPACSVKIDISTSLPDNDIKKLTIEKAIAAINDDLSILSTDEKQIVWTNLFKRGRGWISGIKEGLVEKLVVALTHLNMEQEFKDFLRLRTMKKKRFYFNLSYFALFWLFMSVLIGIIGYLFVLTNALFYRSSLIVASSVRAFAIALYTVIPVDELDPFSVLVERENFFSKFFLVITWSAALFVGPFVIYTSNAGSLASLYAGFALCFPQAIYFLWTLREHYTLTTSENYFRIIFRFKVLCASLPAIACFDDQQLLDSSTNLPLLVLWSSTALLISWFLAMASVLFWMGYTRKVDNVVDYHRQHLGAKEFNITLLTTVLGTVCPYMAGVAYAGRDIFQIITEVFCAFVDIVPIIFVLVFGFKKSFDVAIKMLPWLNFDNNISALQTDGIFMSVLVLSCNLQSEDHWIWRKKNCPSYEASPDLKQIVVERRFWLRGKRNLDVGGDENKIEIDYDDDMDNVWQAHYEGMELKKDITSSVANIANPMPSFDDWVDNIAGKVVKSDGRKKAYVMLEEKEGTIKTKEDLERKKEELKFFASRNLRRYEWDPSHWEDNSNYGLMTKSPREMGGEEERRRIYGLSIPVGVIKSEADKIDYFISHSWNDDGKQKTKALRTFSEEFRKSNGRYPTFWLDKICINQFDSNTTNLGIATLPITINACKKVLVLMGETYMTRLWCIWELFTLFTFRNKEHARAMLTIRALGKDGKYDKNSKDGNTATLGSDNSKHALEQVSSFDIDKAHCFDPNEELKLRYLMIDLIGPEKVTHAMNGILVST